MTKPTAGKHPAPFTESIIERLGVIIPKVVPDGRTIHDPFGGEGVRLGALCDRIGYEFSGTDLEMWQDGDPRVVEGDATYAWSYPTKPYAVVTSPCLAHGQRVLRDDLRWIPVEDIGVGDTLVAFDESPTTLLGGIRSARRWRLTEVTYSEAQPAECVKIHLSNGETVVCTLNHPWLAERSPNSSSTGTKWIEAQNLKDQVVHRQMNTWDDADSYQAGWLAGIYDGEGTLASGDRTSLKLSVIQKPGLVLDTIKEALDATKIDWTAYARSSDDCEIIYVNGGINRTMETLGHLRPVRLLARWSSFDLWGKRVIQGAERVRVLEVEPIGVREIQGITTTTGTYIGEGYLHHNTYNNGVNDHFKSTDGSRRLTYRERAGHELDPTNTGRWSGRGSRKAEAEYWKLTRKSITHWPDIAIVNVKDSVRSTWEGGIYPLVRLWAELLEEFGYDVTSEEVSCPGWRFGSNNDKRLENEVILVATHPFRPSL